MPKLLSLKNCLNVEKYRKNSFRTGKWVFKLIKGAVGTSSVNEDAPLYSLDYFFKEWAMSLSCLVTSRLHHHSRQNVEQFKRHKKPRQFFNQNLFVGKHWVTQNDCVGNKHCICTDSRTLGATLTVRRWLVLMWQLQHKLFTYYPSERTFSIHQANPTWS